MAIEQVVGIWNERRAWPPSAMSAGRKSETVVTPVRAAITLPSPICSVDAVGSAEIRDRWALMKNRLPVIAEDRDFGGRDAESFTGCQSGFGVDLTEPEIELAQVAAR